MDTAISDPPSELKPFVELDRRLVEAAKSVKILTHLGWQREVVENFFIGWRSGNPKLPEVTYPPIDLSPSAEALETVLRDADQSHPIGSYIYQTAESCIVAIEMLHSRGSTRFTDLSKTLYGVPTTQIGSDSITLLDAANDFINSTTAYAQSSKIEEHDVCILAATVARELQEGVNKFFDRHSVEVVIDPNLTSKAAAGARRVRIRGFTCFSPLDIPQLLRHECFVHTLTLLNGREQPYLKSLGIGAPRTTRTQEGLAVFAERIDNVMDLSRLRRLALRVKAIELGLQGADFLDLFRFFLESGQPEFESFQSAARVFRGGDVHGGGIVFTKDLTYLQGLLDVQVFLRKSIQESRFDYPHRLFCGRLDLADLPLLEPFFESGFIAPPIYEPSWIKDRHCLIAFLLFSNVFRQVKFEGVTLAEFLNDREYNQGLGVKFTERILGYVGQLSKILAAKRRTREAVD